LKEYRELSVERGMRKRKRRELREKASLLVLSSFSSSCLSLRSLDIGVGAGIAFKA
jgi:hypothetical protein